MKDAQTAANATPAPTPSDAATPRKGEPSYIPEVWTERSVEDTLFLSGGKGIAHAHNYAITRITAEKDKLIAELQATQFEFCEECNFPLSACGEQNPDGTPSMGCKVCQLRAALASRDADIERLQGRFKIALIEQRQHLGAMHDETLAELARVRKDADALLKQQETDSSRVRRERDRETDRADRLEKLSNRLYSDLRNGVIPEYTGSGLIDEVMALFESRNRAVAKVETMRAASSKLVDAARWILKNHPTIEGLFEVDAGIEAVNKAFAT